MCICQEKGLLQGMYHVDISFLCHFRLGLALGPLLCRDTQMVLYLARRGSRKVNQQAAASCRVGKSFSKKKRFCYRSGTIFALFYSCSTWNLKLDAQCGIIFGFSRRYIFQLSFQGSPYQNKIKVQWEMGKTTLFIIPALLKMAIEVISGKYYEIFKGNSRLSVDFIL